MNNWYECKVKYEKTLETGTQKKVTEAYLVDAMSFTEAENRIIEDFNDGDMRFDDDGNETLDLICRLDQIRELINDYHNETTIVD